MSSEDKLFQIVKEFLLHKVNVRQEEIDNDVVGYLAR